MEVKTMSNRSWKLEIEGVICQLEEKEKFWSKLDKVMVSNSRGIDDCSGL